MKSRFLKLLILVSVATLPFARTFAATYTASATGNWSAAGTWTNANNNKTGTITASTSNTTVTGTGTSFLTELSVGSVIATQAGVAIGTVASIVNATSLTLTTNASNNVTTAATYRTTDGPGGSADAVVISNGVVLTIDAVVLCTTITFTAGTGTSSIAVNSPNSITASSTITVSSSVNATVGTRSFSGTGTITCNGITVGSNVSSSTNGTYVTALTTSVNSLVINGNVAIMSYIGTSTVRINNAQMYITDGTVDISGQFAATNENAVNTSVLQVGGTAPTVLCSNATPFPNVVTGNYTKTLNSTGATINYDGAAQTVNGGNYLNLILSGSGAKTLLTGTTSVTNFTLSGTASTTTVAGIAITDDLTIGNGCTFNAAGFALTVTDSTFVNGNLTVTSATGTKAFGNIITVASGGAWTNTAANSPITINGGGITVISGGTFSSGSGLYTFQTGNSTITGSFTITSATVTSITLTIPSGSSITLSTLAGTGPVTLAGTLTSGALTGSGAISFSGSSPALNYTGAAAPTPTLNVSSVLGTVTYNGTTQTIKATTYGNLTLTGSSITKTAAGAFAVSNNLDVGSTVTFNMANNDISVGQLIGSGTVTNTSGTAGARLLTLTGNSTATFSGTISNGTATSLSITKTGFGTVTFSGASSSYTGVLTIAGGVFRPGVAGTGSAGPFGNASGVTVTYPGTLDFNGFSVAASKTLTIDGVGNNDVDGAIANSGSAITYSGGIVLGGSATINATGNITLSGSVTAAATRVLTLSGSSTNSNLNGVINSGGSTTAGLIKSGSGTWTIGNNTNQYSGGTTISGGTLSITNLTTTTNLGTGGITMDGGTLQYNGSTQSTALNFVFNNSTSSTINVNSGATTLTISSAITGGGSLVKSGAGTLTFGNNATLAGITVSAGTLNPGTGTINVSGNFDGSGGGISSPVTAIVNFNGSGTQTFTPGSGVTYNNVQINNTSNPVTLAGATTINALTVNTNTTFSDGGFQITGGSGTLTVDGTLKLGGTNATTFPTFTSTTLGSGSTVEYASNNVSAQAIAARSYANLVSSGTGPRTLPSGTINISGSFTPGSNVYTNTGNTINFNGTTAQSVPSFDYYNNLTVSGSRSTSSVTFGSDVKVQGDFSPTASFTSGGYVTTGSTFTFNGSSYQYINNSFAFNSVTVNSSAAVVLSADASIGSSGVLTLTSGQLSLNDYTLTLFGNTITTTGGSLDCSGQVIGSGGTLKCSQSGSLNLTYSVVSGGINNLTVDQGGTLSLREEISSNIFDVGGVLNVTGNSRVELYEGANLQITGTVSMGSGSPTGYIKANSADQVNTKARMRIAGGNRNVGTLYFDQGIDRSSNAISEFVVATSVSGASVTLGNKLNITNLFTPLTDSKSFTLNSGGNLTMRSSSVWTSSVGQVGSNFVFSGDVVTERWVNAKSVRRYVFIGVPTNGVTIRNAWQDSTFITAVGGSGGQICGSTSGNGGPTDRYNDSGYDATTANLYTVFRFNGSAWVGVGTAADTTRLWSGYGYRILYRGPRFTNGSSNCTALLNTGGSGIAADSTSLTAKGSLTTGSLTVPINSKPGAASYGYTVLANPYHCQIDFNTFHANNVGSSGINRGFWIHDPNGASTTGYVTTFNNGSGWQIVGRDVGSPSFNTNTTYLPYIAPGQGFFVSTANAANNLTVTFQETHKVVPTAQQNGAFRSTDSNPNENDKIRTVLLKADSSYIDDMLVLFSNDAGVTKSTFDAKYDIISLNSGSFVAGIKGGRSCGIQTRPISFYNDTVSLRVTSASTGNFVLRFMEYELFDSAASIILLDSYTGTEWDVKADPYYSFTITSNAATQGVNRFKLVFRSQLSVLPVSFLSVSAMKKPEGAEVKWRVAFEQKIDRYEVERSDDGRVFKSVGTIGSQGDSYIPVDYSYTDRNTITGTVYYRVKSVEQGGGIKYSSIVKLNSSKETLMSVYPNPVKDELRVQISGLSTDARPVVVIRNLQGKTVKQQQLGGSTGNYGIDVKELPAGLYVIQVELSNGQRLTEKFVKQ